MSRRNLSAVADAAGLPEGYRVTRYAKGDVCDRMWVERDVRDRACPRCGHAGHVNGHYRRRVWHVPSGGGSQLCLLLDQVRLRCPCCGKGWSDGHDELAGDAGRNTARAVADGIQTDLMLRKSVKEAGQAWGPSRHLADEAPGRALDDWQRLPATLCVDGSEADTDAGRMAVGTCDGDAGNIVEVPHGMRRDATGLFLGSFPAEERAGVAYFCCDMSPEMVAARDEWFPSAKPRVDRSRVARLADEAPRDARSRARPDESTPAEPCGQPEGSWRLLVMGRDRLRRTDDEYALDLAERRATVQRTLAPTDEEMNEIPRLRAREPRAIRVRRLLAPTPELEVAYGPSLGLRVIHRNGKLGWWDGMPRELRKWCSLATASRIPELVSCAKTTRRNAEGIPDSCRHGRTNAVAEGTDNSIKAAKRRGYGIRRFEAFRRRVLLALGLGRAEVVRITIRDVEDR